MAESETVEPVDIRVIYIRIQRVKVQDTVQVMEPAAAVAAAVKPEQALDPVAAAEPVAVAVVQAPQTTVVVKKIMLM